MDHRQVLVSLHGEKIEVDEGLVNVLSTLWSAGVSTRFSCQGVADDPGSGYIVFETAADLKRAVSVLGIGKDQLAVYYYDGGLSYDPDEYPAEKVESLIESGHVVAEVMPNALSYSGGLGVRYAIRADVKMLAELEKKFSGRVIKLPSFSRNRPRKTISF